MYKEIDSYSLRDLLNKDKNIHLIDIRDNYHYISGCIPNAKNIPTNYLITNPTDYLDKNEVYYFYCNSGSTSRRLCQFLANKGYNVVNIEDGYMGYLDSR